MLPTPSTRREKIMVPTPIESIAVIIRTEDGRKREMHWDADDPESYSVPAMSVEVAPAVEDEIAAGVTRALLAGAREATS